MNRLDMKSKIYIDDINVEDLVKMKYTKPVEDCVQCPKCKNIFEADLYSDIYPENSNEYIDMEYDDFDSIDDDGINKITCPYCSYTTYANRFKNIWTEDIVDAPNSEEIFPGIHKAYEKLEKESESMKSNKSNKSLQEATIKALYDGLKDDEEISDIEGLVDDVLVVTDPEITTDEYNEIIDRANEIIEDTPDGDIPLDPTYLGEYLQICPICGGSFIQDHIYEPGTACPICLETPESFVLVGQLQSADSVAKDNGIETNMDSNDTLAEPQNFEIKRPSEESPEESPEENQEENQEPVRGARTRRVRTVASKDIGNGNVLKETKELDNLNENVTLLEQDDESNSDDEYTVDIVSDDKINELAENSAFTWEGMDYSKDNLQEIVDDFKENTDIKLPVHFYVFDGKTMNRMFNLTGNNAYPEDLSFVSVDLDNWNSMSNLPVYKVQVGARWLDDIISNNELRQDMINDNQSDKND